MKIELLGTSAAEGWPGLFCDCQACRDARRLGGKNIRTRSSALIDGVLKIDFPPDTYLHVLQRGLDLRNVEYLFFTHGHDDHFAVKELQYSSRTFVKDPLARPVQVFGPMDVIDRIETGLDLTKVPLALNGLDYWHAAAAGPFVVTPIEANHEPDEVCFNLLIERDGKTLLYATDTGWYGPKTWDYLERLKLDAVVIECTKGRVEDGYAGHLSASQVIAAKQRLESAGALRPNAPFITTHHSHLGGLLHHELEALLNPHGIEVGFDGMTIEL